MLQRTSRLLLLLAVIFCLRVYAFNMWFPISTTYALEDVRVSLSPVQSASEYVVNSVLI